jgi:hypothetical protein
MSRNRGKVSRNKGNGNGLVGTSRGIRAKWSKIRAICPGIRAMEAFGESTLRPMLLHNCLYSREILRICTYDGL